MKIKGLRLAAENRILMLGILESEGSDKFWKSRIREDLSFVKESFFLGLKISTAKNVVILIENRYWNVFFSIESLLIAPVGIIEAPIQINNILKEYNQREKNDS